MRSIEDQLLEQSRGKPRPTAPVFVLDNGIRVPLDLRYVGESSFGATWQPVIEGEVERLMERIVALDAEVWPPDCALKFPAVVPQAWTQRLLANSPILKRTMHSREVMVKADEVNAPPTEGKML